MAEFTLVRLTNTIILIENARVVELAYTIDSKSIALMGMRVRVPPRANPPMAQRIAHQISNLDVGGSSPSGRAKRKEP